jgi:hypothetical protein
MTFKIDSETDDLVKLFSITIDGKPKYPTTTSAAEPIASNVVDLAEYRRKFPDPEPPKTNENFERTLARRVAG